MHGNSFDKGSTIRIAKSVRSTEQKASQLAPNTPLTRNQHNSTSSETAIFARITGAGVLAGHYTAVEAVVDSVGVMEDKAPGRSWDSTDSDLLTDLIAVNVGNLSTGTHVLVSPFFNSNNLQEWAVFDSAAPTPFNVVYDSTALTWTVTMAFSYACNVGINFIFATDLSTNIIDASSTFLFDNIGSTLEIQFGVYRPIVSDDGGSTIKDQGNVLWTSTTPGISADGATDALESFTANNSVFQTYYILKFLSDGTFTNVPAIGVGSPTRNNAFDFVGMLSHDLITYPFLAYSENGGSSQLDIINLKDVNPSAVTVPASTTSSVFITMNDGDSVWVLRLTDAGFDHAFNIGFIITDSANKLTDLQNRTTSILPTIGLTVTLDPTAITSMTFVKGVLTAQS